MTGCVNKFNEHKNINKNKNKNTITMSPKVKDKKLFKITRKYGKKLMDIDFNTKPTDGNDDKYIKTKIKAYEDNITFIIKKGLKKYQNKKYHISVYQ